MIVARFGGNFYFNPRSPRGERRGLIYIFIIFHLFQSTLSARRATVQDLDIIQIVKNFNPRSPRGERLRRSCSKNATAAFQSTLSARRATYFSGVKRTFIAISIHALREESDLVMFFCVINKIFQSTLSARRATDWVLAGQIF